MTNEGQAERDREKNREVKNRNIQRDRMYRTGKKFCFTPWLNADVMLESAVHQPYHIFCSRHFYYPDSTTAPLSCLNRILNHIDPFTRIFSSPLFFLFFFLVRLFFLLWLFLLLVTVFTVFLLPLESSDGWRCFFFLKLKEWGKTRALQTQPLVKYADVVLVERWEERTSKKVNSVCFGMWYIYIYI